MASRTLPQAGPPRPIAERLAAPGLHLIAEIKRASPSAGRIAGGDEDIVARARAYEAGGAAAISVLCEPHWFGGSIDDLRAVRAAVGVPVLAKEFVVDAGQLDGLRAAGADLVLLLAVLHPARRLARLVARARDLGLEPLVEAHDERELRAALATDARLIGLNNRDLRTLDVDVTRADRLRALVPDDRLVIAESGVRDPATIARWRALGFDGALVGEALVRADDPAAVARAFVAAGRAPVDLANVARRPFVKICGVTDVDGALAAVRAGADAIGLNVVPGTPRALSIEEAATLAAAVRGAAPPDARPRLVLVTADLPADQLAAFIAAVDPDAIQYNGEEPVATIAESPRPAWKVLHLPVDTPADAAGSAGRIVGRARAYLEAGATRLLLDTAGGPHPGGTGLRASSTLAAAVAREVPVTLAGGLAPVIVATALREIPAVGVDVASGTEAPRDPGERPRKDPFKVALFVKRAKASRDDRPNTAFGPTPAHAGLLDADGGGRWGMERDFGGRYVPETLMAALAELETAYDALRHDPVFWADLRELLERFAGRPTALYRADRLAVAVEAEAARLASGVAGTGAHPAIPTVRLYLKREDLAHTGAHKINNALGQALLTRRLGKTRVIAETGAGQHGVATATACALLDLPCVVYMGAEDIERQGPNVLRMRALGAEVRSVTSGTATLKDAVNEAMRDWVTNVETTHYVLGSAMGPHPYPTIVRDLQRRIGDEAAAQLDAVEGRLPDLALACVGGGSNAIGLLARFIGEPTVRLAVAEAAGDGMETGRHAAAILGGTPGILHGSRSLMLQDRDGQVVEAHSASAGLDYPGIGPQLAALAEAGRIEVAAATDREAVAAMKATTRTEGILPALETSHAIAALPKILAGVDGLAGGFAADRDLLVLLGFSGTWRQGPRRAHALRRRRAVGDPAMTGDEVRALCLGLPGTTEKETWATETEPGHPTFRVRDKIFVIMAVDGTGGSIRTTLDEQAALVSAFPGRGERRGVRRAVRLGRSRFPARARRRPARDHRGRVGAHGPQAGRRGMAGGAMTTIVSRLPDAVAGDAADTTAAPEGTNETAGARRIAAAFAAARTAGRAALIPYVVAGYPDADTSLRIALAAADAGADLLEVGLPYSDPLADGATLQRASGVALRAGATLEGSLRLIERIGAARPDLPLVPMAYANQIIGGGDGEAVAHRLARAGAAGVIVADLTPDEGAPFEAVARDAGLAVVYLVAPTTPPDRRRAIARRSGGFLYCVSLVGVTGARTALPTTVARLVKDVTAGSPIPVGVGFGVSTPAHVRSIARAGADGVIVASALVDALGPDGSDVEALATLVRALRKATAR